jgi:hypothetical protein
MYIKTVREIIIRRDFYWIFKGIIYSSRQEAENSRQIKKIMKRENNEYLKTDNTE